MAAKWCGMPRACVMSLLSLGLASCGADERVTAPTPVLATPVGHVWGYVFLSFEGACDEGAWVEIIDGPKAGELSNVSCDEYSGYVLFPPFGQVVTLRASRLGYRSQELRLMVVNGGAPTNFTLQKE